MATIHVLKPFVLALAGGERVPYAAGTHRGVPDDHAEHWFTKAHIGDAEDLPAGVVDAGEFALMRKDFERLKEAFAAMRDETNAEVDRVRSEGAAALAEAADEVAQLRTALAEAVEARTKAEADLEAAHALMSETKADDTATGDVAAAAAAEAEKVKGKKAA